MVVTDRTSHNWIAASKPVAPGSSEWQQLTVDFVVPQTESPGILVSIKRKPKFSYDEPTRGTVWFDDFIIKQQ